MSRGTHGGVVFDFTFQNFVRSLDPLYLRIYALSLKFATLTSLVCLLLGYPTAYVMATSHPKIRSFLLMLVMVPFLTNFVIRAYGIKILLGRHGPFNEVGMALGLISSPLALTDGPMAVWFGMITNYLPFMVIPLFSELSKFDFRLLEAARDLGASGWQATTRILLPLTIRPMMVGCVLVFIPAFGEFIIPDFLGGARQMLIGNLLTEQFLKARDWPFGCALSIGMLGIVLSFYVIQSRFFTERK